ncbi:hypothetical protein [uncultured Cohaesibacter sp.]|uniref:alpha/beta fold hydrolase n=1 Tax=uncultured Cohaesibacter sp. TaxID=1002546 RepID=UPI002AAC14D9|nr:hypothetical protein [uncultured Cohaesibacter sp.]
MRILSDDALYAADIFIKNTGPIVFAFDNMASAGPIENRKGWGYDFIRSQSINVVSFLETRSTAWYRPSSFLEFLDELEQVIDFSKFSSRISYGGSMGGYAAGAFASRLNCDAAILLNPVSSLSKELAPWETRFEIAKKVNWSSSYHDAAEGIVGVPHVYLVADSLHSLDLKHIKRFERACPSCEFYRFPGVGHGIAVHMHALGVLKPFVLDIFNSRTPDKAEFFQAIRQRRDYVRYYKQVFIEKEDRITPARANILAQNLARTLKRNRVPKKLAIQIFQNITALDPTEFGLELPASAG